MFLCLKFDIWLKAKYTQGILNNLADTLSRFQVDRFRQMDRFRWLFPEVDEEGIPYPEHLWEVI